MTGITAAERLRIDIRNAYEVHDREALEQALKRIPESMQPFALGPGLSRMMDLPPGNHVVTVDLNDEPKP